MQPLENNSPTPRSTNTSSGASIQRPCLRRTWAVTSPPDLWRSSTSASAGPPIRAAAGPTRLRRRQTGTVVAESRRFPRPPLSGRRRGRLCYGQPGQTASVGGGVG